ncbi:uncharacterized protein LOC101852177 [Aplysia californica]|uniref:Uncharacterized protein LOC101852177 n=1 Tax=Aplysia californica TaxID=6500 RepID=A0ABM1A0C9_APLCA|nr:uncharacterized protein LOC101852177 [Aplysia californica]
MVSLLLRNSRPGIRSHIIRLLKLGIAVTVVYILTSYLRLIAFPHRALTDTMVTNQNRIAEIGVLKRTVTDQKCVHPQLNVHDPAIMKFYKEYKKLDCFRDAEWVSLSRGQFVKSSEVEAKVGKMECDLTPIERDGDFNVKDGKRMAGVANGTKIDRDFYRVECRAAGGKTYKNIHAGIRNDKTIADRAKTFVGEKGLGLDIFIFGQDSTSRLAMLRHQPKTREYLVKELGAIELEGYNILGDGTPAALLPILTGKREEELPEARRGFKGAEPVDRFPWIWDYLKGKGYATMWTEQAPGVGTFHYRMLGFKEQPVDHFYRPFSLVEEKFLEKGRHLCLGSRSRYGVVLDYSLDMWNSYPKDRRKFAFSFMTFPSHSNNNELAAQDEELRDYLRKFKEAGHLDNTLLIVMADHGARFENVRATDQGKLEERLPYFAVRFPPWVHQKHPEIVDNFRHNAQMLTTPFDVHETLREVANFTGTGPADVTKRAVSLFKRIPDTRLCENAEVDDHWCACLSWQEIALDSPETLSAVNETVKFFNSLTEKYSSKCARLEVDQVISASQHTTRQSVLKFKDTNDGGRGRFGKMTDNTRRSLVTYQVTFITKPGGGRFDVTLSRNTDTGAFYVDTTGVSRTNAYGDQPKCVASEAPHLRMFCLCV